MNNKKVYTIYKYNQFNNDFEYIKEYYNTKDIQAEYKLKNIKSVYNYMYNSIDNINLNNLLKCQYIIIKDIL